ncbi:MAG: ribosome maturation factor RimM [Clostridia bacterium]
MTEILIGTILKPQGIKGEVKVKVYTNDLNRFLRYHSFVLNKVERQVEKIRVDGQFGYVKFVGINSMNDAETLRDFDVYVKKDAMPSLQDDEYYIADLMGSEVCFVGGKPFAKVIDVFTETRNVVIVAKGEKTYSFPLIKDVLVKVDTENSVIELREEKFNEVSLIED